MLFLKIMGAAILLFFPLSQGMSDVLVIDGTDRIQMKYSLADNKTSSTVFGANGRSTLNGKKADLRLKGDSPQFLLYSDPAVNLSNAIALVRLDVKSDHREITMVKVRLGSVSSSLPKDHVMNINIEEVRTEPGNRRMKVYKIVPTTPLPPGEYCLIRNRLYYFDFGIEVNQK